MRLSSKPPIASAAYAVKAKIRFDRVQALADMAQRSVDDTRSFYIGQVSGHFPVSNGGSFVCRMHPNAPF